MTEGKQIYAMVSGIVALLLVLALAFVVLSGTPAPKKMLKQTSRQGLTEKEGPKRVRAMVRTPDMNTLKQAVTVKK